MDKFNWHIYRLNSNVKFIDKFSNFNFQFIDKFVKLNIIYMELPIHIKLSIKVCMLTLNMITTGTGTSHISQIVMLESWSHGPSD